MEPSKISGDTEECSSNESGWTMYIASSTHEKNTIDDEQHYSFERQLVYKNAKKEDGESDDSTASDATSGPSQHGSIDGSHGMGDFKQKGVKDGRKYSVNKSYRKAERKLCAERTKSAKEEPEGYKGKSASGDTYYGRGKFRKKE